VELYLRSLIRLHDMVLSLKSTGDWAYLSPKISSLLLWSDKLYPAVRLIMSHI
jgi:hypothetical protein